MDLWNKIKETFTGMKEAIFNAWERILDFMKNLPHNLGFILGRMVRRLVIFNTRDVPRFIMGVVAWFAKLPGRVFKWLMITAKKLIQSIPTFLSNAKQLGGKLVEGFISQVKQLPGRIKDIFFQALDAIGGFAGKLFEKAKNVAGDFWNGFKEGLGISSPSYIERAFMNIEEQGRHTLAAMKDTVRGMGDISLLPQMQPQISGFGAGNQNITNQNVRINVNQVSDMQDVHAIGREMAFRLQTNPRFQGEL